MRSTWLNTARDWKTLVAGIAILLLPLSFYASVVINRERAEQIAAIQEVSDSILLDFDSLINRLNSALILLSSTFQECDDRTLAAMDELSFDLPGVEAFMHLNEYTEVSCSNWNYDLNRLDSDFAEKLSEDKDAGVNISIIERTGVIVFRNRIDGSKIAGLISSAYLQQLLAATSHHQDRLAIYNRSTRDKIASLWSISTLQWQYLNQLSDTDMAKTGEYGNFYVSNFSTENDDISVVYFFETISISEILNKRFSGVVITLLFSFFMAWRYLVHRHKKINSIEHQLQIALKRNEFAPFVQPIVNMQTGEWIGAEVLIRWMRDDAIVAYPNEFIPIAESSGLIKDITHNIMIDVVKQSYHWLEDNKNFYFSINLSPNFIDQKVIDSIDFIKQQYSSVAPHNLRFEITEHGISDHRKEFFDKVIEKLEKEKYLIGLDDFGTGQSGLEYFNNINPAFLKIDRRFVVAINNPESIDFQLLNIIVQLAQSFDIEVIAEGVETASQSDWLMSKGIRYGQGWLYQRAKPLDDFLKWVEINKTVVNEQLKQPA